MSKSKHKTKKRTGEALCASPVTSIPPEIAELQEHFAEVLNTNTNSGVSLQVLTFVVEHKQEFPALQEEMVESMKTSRLERGRLIDAGISTITDLVFNYNLRENIKIFIGSAAIAATAVAAGWLFYEREYQLGVIVIGMVFGGSVLTQIFSKK